VKHFEVSYTVTHKGTAIVEAKTALEAQEKFDDYADHKGAMNALTVFRRHMDAEVKVTKVESVFQVDPGKVDIS